jgi:phosphopantetheinyl transferase
MMPIAWRYAAIEATCRQAEPAEAWLVPRERLVYASLRDPGRRAEWLAGRILTKRLVSERFQPVAVPPARIEIDSGDGRTRRLRPRILMDGRPLDWRLSIAHSGRSLLVAVANSDRWGVGVDLVEPIQCGRGFTELWFTPSERRWLAPQGRLWTTAWAIKEAAYKAANRGEAFRPRAFEVLPAPGGGFVCAIHGRQPDRLHRLVVWRTPQDETAILALYDSQVSSADGGRHD